MSEKHNHGLTLDDVQKIIGRGVVDQKFREAFVQDPYDVVSRLGISVDNDGGAVDLLKAISTALQGGEDIQAAMDSIKKAYERSADGVIRPNCA